jgi:hypothetical protein
MTRYGEKQSMTEIETLLCAMCFKPNRHRYYFSLPEIKQRENRQRPTTIIQENSVDDRSSMFMSLTFCVHSQV